MIERDVPERLWAKFFRMIRDAIYDLVPEFHPFIALQGNSPNYQSPITEKTHYNLALPERHRFVMDDSKFLWDSSVHSFENHTSCSLTKIPSFAKNYYRNAKKVVAI